MPVIVLYKLVELSLDVSGAGIFKSVKDALQSEDVDLLNYFRQNLVGYASDSELTMRGKNNGLIAPIRKEARKKTFMPLIAWLTDWN